MIHNLIVKYRYQIAFAVCLSAVSAFLTAATIGLITQSTASNSPAHSVISKVLAMLGLFLVCNLTLHHILARFGANLIASVRAHLTVTFARMEYEATGARASSIAMSISHDLGRIAPLLLLAPQVIYNFLLCLLCLGYVVFISKIFALVAGVAIALIATIYLRVNRRIGARFETVRGTEERVFDHVNTLASAKKQMTLNAERTQHFIDKHMLPSIEDSRSEMAKLHYWWGVVSAATPVVILLLMTGAYGLASMLSVPLEQLTKLIIVGVFLVGPISFLANAAQQIGSGIASIRHLEALGLDLTSIQSPAIGGEQGFVRWKQIDVVNVTYTYASADTDSFVLGPINASFARGSVTFIAGGNGSGKSTFLLLLCSLLSPEKGAIHLDDKDISLDRATFRGLFSPVFNDFHLFRSVLTNASTEDADEVNALIMRFGLASKVSLYHDELSTTQLSTGQRKRLALIQSLAENRDVLLLDEWAADQDAAFREFFYRVLIPGWRAAGKTVVAVTHDERYFDACDALMELDQGKLSTRPHVSLVC